MEKYFVSGMSCAACSAKVEKAVSAVKGVESCSVSLLTNTLGVEGTASEKDIISAVEKAGYGASSSKTGTKASGASGSSENLDASEKEIKTFKTRLICSVSVLLILMYFSMGHSMWSWPVFPFLNNNPVGLGLLELVLSSIILLFNKKFFVSGFKALVRLSPNMDSLVALGSGVSYAYSLVILFAMTSMQGMDVAHNANDGHALYFESAAMIVTLITVGKLLEAISKGKTTNALKSLLSLAPETAVVIRDGSEVEVPIVEVKVGDIFVCRAGESIPVDGEIVEGETTVNESSLTGESLPVDKKCGDMVTGATINLTGFIKAKALRVGEDTTFSQIIRMVSDASATKAPVAKVADRVSGVFVPAVMGISLVTLIVWLVSGAEVSFALNRAISVLVISCPCALGLATPVAIMVGNGMGAKKGILFKTSAALENTGRTDIVVLDKTGTITKGEPEVTDVMPAGGMTEKDLLEMAYSLEEKSEHPLGKAICTYCQSHEVLLRSSSSVKVLPGNGIEGFVENRKVRGGSLSYFEKLGILPEDAGKLSKKLGEEGKTTLFFAIDNDFAGTIACADGIKEDSEEAVALMKKMGLQVVMLTGDNSSVAKSIARKAGIEHVVSNVLPEGKERAVAALLEQGRVCMVGDGINDAPALTRASVGMAIGAGADVAMDAADVVLVKNSLMDAAKAINLSRITLRNIRENLFWAFFYNVLGIPLAAGAYFYAFGWSMSPMFGALAMSLSSFCVVTNALRINMYNVVKPRKKNSVKVNLDSLNEIKEAKMAEKTVKIEGMMCSHCEAHVKKALEALAGVVSCAPDHDKGIAVLECNAEVSDEAIAKAVEDAGYKVV